LGAAAAELSNVNLMIDAEQTYLQPAIDSLVMQAQREFNGQRAVVMNTYQCYLRDSVDRLVLDLGAAKDSGYVFGVKLVRGAYMNQERRLAAERGYDDPIFAEIGQTHQAFDGAVTLMLDRIDGCDVLIGSHNERSIRLAVRGMHTRGLPPQSPRVAFAQLLGMCDFVTFKLAQKGFRAYKYVPYGPVKEVLPYLLRRAQENSDMLGTGGKEMTLVFKELAGRISPIKF